MAKKSAGSGKPDDSRFASASYDPRFIVPSTKKNKVKVDERFSRSELQKLNTTATGKKAKVDRYGRKVKDDENALFDKYFEEESDPSAKTSESESEKSDSDGSGSESDAAKPPQLAKKTKKVQFEDALESEESEAEAGFVDRARGEGLVSDSETDSDSELGSDAEDAELDLEEEEKPEEGEPSSTFAVVNLDWDNVRAVDLLSTFSSFVPKGGVIQLVQIFPSEFGKEQMLKEEVEGPPKELFRKKRVEAESESDSDEELDLTNKDDLEKAARKLYEEDDGKEDYDHKALRKYQLQRLRYYYAVVKCDSVSTAQAIYTSCDGSEYELTANVFDLRYVPEGMEFDASEARDTCTKVPASYRPDLSFVTDALQHSKVKLTWDETPKGRLTLSTRLFSQKQIDDMDFQAYLASDSDGSDEELKDKYRNLLGGKFAKKDADSEEDDVDMEITFNPGLDEGAEPANEAKEPETEESTIQAYKRKEKERRQKRAEKFKEKSEGEKSEEPVPKDKKDKKDKKHKKHKQPVDEKSKAELELLMLDENEKPQAEHFNMRDIVKAEKNKHKKKGPKYDDTLVQDTFRPDLSDDRFKEVFENHEFAIDPTSSEYKKTNTMKEILAERGRRLRPGKRAAEPLEPTGSALNALVKKLKLKK